MNYPALATMSIRPRRDDANPLVAWALWADGVFELALGAVLVTAPLTGLTDAMSLSSPASPAVIVVFGVALLAAGAYLIGLSRNWRAATVRVLAVVNLGGAVAFAGWLAVSWGECAVAGRLMIGLTAVALALLGAVELAGLSRPRPAR